MTCEGSPSPVSTRKFLPLIFSLFSEERSECSWVNDREPVTIDLP